MSRQAKILFRQIKRLGKQKLSAAQLREKIISEVERKLELNSFQQLIEELVESSGFAGIDFGLNDGSTYITKVESKDGSYIVHATHMVRPVLDQITISFQVGNKT